MFLQFHYCLDNKISNNNLYCRNSLRILTTLGIWPFGRNSIVVSKFFEIIIEFEQCQKPGVQILTFRLSVYRPNWVRSVSKSAHPRDLGLSRDNLFKSMSRICLFQSLPNIWYKSILILFHHFYIFLETWTRVSGCRKDFLGLACWETITLTLDWNKTSEGSLKTL
jgi:hypothetical protein